MSKTYLVYLPTFEGSIEDEWKQCLDQVIQTGSSGLIPVKLNVFVDLPDFESLLRSKKIISDSVIDSFGSSCPAINISVLPPEKPWKIAVEGTFTSKHSAKVTGKIFQSVPYIIIESDGLKEVWAGGVSSYRYTDDTRKAAEAAFELMVAILENENLSLNNLVRQWNFIGDILTMKNGFQNYQIFNEVRNEFYQKYRTVAGYPSATGIGMKYGGVVLDFCAIDADKSLQIKAIDNPNQVNAYNYGQQFLVGLSKKSIKVKHPPQFERALLLAGRREAILHISGTASIIGQETMGKGDIREQTLVTLENIKKLTDTERISQLISRPLLYRNKFTFFRVYIRDRNDFGIVRDICNEHFPDVPAIYIEADICRNDLLMEIEAESELIQ